ncbi:hypothetical protein [Pedobacter nanyangensis]|uniref:hypothetical protein n=1 Tax=Pedobacter nanyangensis TaxID=1562389 RepID=UPI000DE4F5A9|nr:hypothetical protein [Pedobacter nanyangensis]
MEKIVTWTKGVFDSSYQIFCNGQICGNLIFETWNNHAVGIMSQTNYHFKCKGFIDTAVTIYGDNHVELGHIKMNVWQMRAIINLPGQIPLTWNYSNAWLNQWTISNHQDTQLHYKSSSSSGMVNGQNLDHELALLVGLYIREFFSRLLVAFISLIAIMVIIRGI